jgi:hypothetical protein
VSCAVKGAGRKERHAEWHQSKSNTFIRTADMRGDVDASEKRLQLRAWAPRANAGPRQRGHERGSGRGRRADVAVGVGNTTWA